MSPSCAHVLRRLGTHIKENLNNISFSNSCCFFPLLWSGAYFKSINASEGPGRVIITLFVGRNTYNGGRHGQALLPSPLRQSQSLRRIISESPSSPARQPSCQPASQPSNKRNSMHKMTTFSFLDNFKYTHPGPGSGHPQSGILAAVAEGAFRFFLFFFWQPKHFRVRRLCLPFAYGQLGKADKKSSSSSLLLFLTSLKSAKNPMITNYAYGQAHYIR